MSYAGLGSSASYKRYWNQYAKACQGMADEGACLNRAVQHGANVTFSASGFGQEPQPQQMSPALGALLTAGLFGTLIYMTWKSPGGWVSGPSYYGPTSYYDWGLGKTVKRNRRRRRR